jgi:hypothetical protein
MTGPIYKKVDKYNAAVYFDEETKEYTFTVDKRNEVAPYIGVVVFDVDEAKAERKFKKAMLLAELVIKLEELRLANLN